MGGSSTCSIPKEYFYSRIGNIIDAYEVAHKYESLLNSDIPPLTLTEGADNRSPVASRTNLSESVDQVQATRIHLNYSQETEQYFKELDVQEGGHTVQSLIAEGEEEVKNYINVVSFIRQNRKTYRTMTSQDKKQFLQKVARLTHLVFTSLLNDLFEMCPP